MIHIENISIFGIHTDVGKTIASAFITEVLESDYWKPIQTGVSDCRDTLTVASLISNLKTVYHQEAFALQMPVSPHKASRLENAPIILENIVLPKTNNLLVIETAGGVYSPVNEYDTMLDLGERLTKQCVLVIKDYLGCINHTMLSAKILKDSKLSLKLIIFSGNFDADTYRFISQNLKDIPQINLPFFNVLNKKNIKFEAEKYRKEIKKIFDNQ